MLLVVRRRATNVAREWLAHHLPAAGEAASGVQLPVQEGGGGREVLHLGPVADTRYMHDAAMRHRARFGSGDGPAAGCLRQRSERRILLATHSIASHRIASHRIASHRIASHRIASHRIASHRIASHRVA
jgi:hypothetical protein